MEKRYDIAALGELLVDMVEGPASDQDNMTFEACPGGAPCNLLAMMNKAGHSTAFIGKVGDDFLGRMLAETIESIGIDTAGLVYDPEVKTTLAFVHKKPDGDRDFSFYRNPGADMMLNPSDVCTEIIAGSKIFHFGTLSMTSQTSREATELAVQTAEDNNLIISFDPNLRPPLWDSLDRARDSMQWGLKHCSILKVSDDEISFLTGCSDMDEALKKLIPMTTAAVIFVTLGRNGSMGWCRDWQEDAGAEKGKAVLYPEVVDTTGAGDTFFGMALHCIMEYGISMTHEQMKTLLSRANKTAGKITQVKGALKVMPEPEE